MRGALLVFQDLTMMVVRIGLGLLMIVHGWQRWQVGIDTLVRQLDAAGVPQATVLAWGSVLLEFIGGLLLVFGLLVPLVALAFLVQNVLIAVWLKQGWQVSGGGWEYNAALAALALVFVVQGSGRAGLDHVLFSRRSPDPEQKIIREIP